MTEPVPAVEPAATIPPEATKTAVETTPPAEGAPERLPDDHPLVTAFEAQKAKLAEANNKLKVIDDANKTDAQRQADALAELQKENATLKASSLRAEVAKAKSDPAKNIIVPADLLTGTTKEELEASADALLAFRGGTAAKLPGNQQAAGPVSSVKTTEESRDDRRKRLEEGLKR